jgi:hypothetical protein
MEMEGRIRVGPSANGYGIDALSVGGHAAVNGATAWSDRHLGPRDRDREKHKESFAPDHTFVLTRADDGRLEPFLPGSSLRGPLRHTLSRHLRAQGQRIKDPNVPMSPTPKAEGSAASIDLPLFGTMEKSAALLVRDAHLVDSERWTAAWLQHHAEDEFAGGVYGVSKFDRTVLIEGTFAWRIVVETQDAQVIDNFARKHWPVLKQLALSGHLPVGGARWRSAGWPAWSIGRTRLGKAGEDAHDI